MQQRPDRLAMMLRRGWPFLLTLSPLAAAYVYLAFTVPQPDLRIALRTAPIVPLAIWTVFLDGRWPLQEAPAGVRVVGRSLLLLLTVAFAALVLGLGLNWIYTRAASPERSVRVA